MLRTVALVLFVLIGALQMKLWTGQGGMREMWALQQSIAAQTNENAQLRVRNDALRSDVDDLKDGSEAVEERARSELGLIKPGETFYQVVEPTAAAPPATF